MFINCKENNLNVNFVDSYNPYGAGVFVEQLVCFSGSPSVKITSSLIHFVFNVRQNLYFHALFRLHLPFAGTGYGRCFPLGSI
jgi:hypothetical protein